jgi:catechol 2,3-dioxygenase-like lactoylglutathione lyase family enzyme
MMAPLTLNHFSIRSLEIDKTVAFYSQVLDLKKGPRPDFPFPGVWLYSGADNNYNNAVLHLIAIDKNDPAGLQKYLGDRDTTSLQGSGAIDHIAFLAAGLGAMLNKLKTLAIPYRERTVPVLKLHQIFVDDPNGIVIELNYPAAEKAALDAPG